MGIKQTYVSGCSFELCITDNSWAQSPADHCRSDALQCMQLLQCTCCPDGARSYTLPLQSSCHSDPVLSAPSQAYTSSSSSSSQNIKTCRQAKLIIQGHSSGRTRQLFRLPRQKLRLATGMLTGHSQLNRHLSVMGIISDPTCNYCGEGLETAAHFLCESTSGDMGKILFTPFWSWLNTESCEKSHRFS